MSLSVLHISESDAGGGAERAAVRIHSTLREIGVGSRMLVGRHQTDDPDIRALKRNIAWRAADRAAGEVLEPLGLQYLFFPSSFAVAADPWFKDASVVQLHNTHGSYFSHTALPYLTRKRPTVWLLHDMWAMTGHVAYSYDCERWRDGCGSCPYLAEYPALARDTSAFLWRWKKETYARSNLTVVSPSRWLADLVQQSPLLGRFPVHHIPYGVDTDTFATGDRAAARRRLDLPLDRQIVLFVATALDERRKGLRLMEEAVRGLRERPLLLTVGRGPSYSTLETRILHGITDDHLLAEAYRAADLLVLPTLADNFPNVVIETMACGTPCVAFDTGGVADAVRHLETGWIAKRGDGIGLCRGLQTLLDDVELRGRLAARAREVVVDEYGLERQARRYLDLYANLVDAA